ncbi:hypothetical protein EP331_01555 [bacterium]|nr:MAG: hypothetical protein EP331_01555 [bacterium]
MKRLSLLSVFIILVILVITSDMSFAQPPPPILPSGPSQAPIDGGLGILLAGGGVYALKKLRAKR